MPVGFKWFVDGLSDGTIGFGGEESAGASFLRRDGSVWTTDKDGIILALLASEITAVTGKTPSRALRRAHRPLRRPRLRAHRRPGLPRGEGPARQALARARSPPTPSPESRSPRSSPRPPATAPPIGGIKVTTANAWFAARPSGTEDVYKIYAESFLGPDHLRRVQEEARSVVLAALGG